MNTFNAYQQSANTTETPREIEYRLIGQVTAALIRAQEPGIEQQQKVDALLWNRSIWSAFRVDLLDPENKLPKELRASLVSLSIFVEKETADAIDGNVDLEALIDINKSIMEGLKPTKAYFDSTPATEPQQGINQVG